MKEGDWTCPLCNNHNYASRQVCNRCTGPRPPPPGENVRPGDWMCPACGNHNYAKRQACNKCQTLKPGLMIDGMAGSFGGARRGYAPLRMGLPMAAGGAAGHFGQFGDYNYPRQEFRGKGHSEFRGKGHSPMMANNNMYGPYRGAAGMMGRYSPYASIGPTTSPPARSMRPGDWSCPKCQNHNYASREFCNKCAFPRNAPANFRDGDWMCPNCNNHNFASKQNCNKCQDPRPM